MYADAHLYSGETPYVDVYVDGVHASAPFRHTLRLYTPDAVDAHWTFDGLDPDEFPPDATLVRPWEWVLDLDSDYGHRTMISCLHSALHGTRLRVHAPKDYRRTHDNATLEVSTALDPSRASAACEEVVAMFQRLEALFPARVTHAEREIVRPLGAVCEYPMHASTYKHE